MDQVVWSNQSLGKVLKIFKQSKGHMAIVREVNSEGPVSRLHSSLLAFHTLCLMFC